MARTIIIGDVHGCWETLEQLIEQLNIQPEDTFISLGDLLHKRAGGAGDTIDLIRNLECNVKFILGNHEDKHIRWYNKTPEKRLQMTWTEEFAREDLTDKDIEWLHAGYLYYSFVINNQKYLCVHAGVAPEHTILKESLLWKDVSSLPSKSRKSLEKLLRLRYIDPEGHSVKSIEDIGPKDKYWADIYGGEHGIVLFGHQPFLRSWGPRIFPYAVGLDTGCVHGNCLTALVLEEGAPATSISVQNPITYCPAIHTPHRNPI